MASKPVILDWLPDYAIGDDGRIFRATWSRAMKAGAEKTQAADKDGYLTIGVTIDGRATRCRVSRLVCEAYHGPAPSPEHHAAHNDGDISNNHHGNLRWATPAENAADKAIHGTLRSGERVYNARLNAAAVADIRATPRYPGVLLDLAKKYGVGRMAVAMVRTKNGNWKAKAAA